MPRWKSPSLHQMQCLWNCTWKMTQHKVSNKNGAKMMGTHLPPPPPPPPSLFTSLSFYIPPLILAELDYSSTTQLIEFISSGSSKISITILDDTVYEGDESFTARLNGTTMGGVNLTTDTLNITIQEDDSKTDMH